MARQPGDEVGRELDRVDHTPLCITGVSVEPPEADGQRIRGEAFEFQLSGGAAIERVSAERSEPRHVESIRAAPDFLMLKSLQARPRRMRLRSRCRPRRSIQPSRSAKPDCWIVPGCRRARRPPGRWPRAGCPDPRRYARRRSRRAHTGRMLPYRRSYEAPERSDQKCILITEVEPGMKRSRGFLMNIAKFRPNRPAHELLRGQSHHVRQGYLWSEAAQGA